MKNEDVKLCLAGDGWGAVAALKSLANYFIKITIVSSDEDLKKIAVEQGFNQKESIFDVDSDLYICAGYKPLIPFDFFVKNKVINIHYSLLPKYRGMHSTVWAILNGERQLGLTVHEMNEDIDDGPILEQFVIDYEDQTSYEIMTICNSYIRANLGSIVQKFLNGDIKAISQNFLDASWVCKRNYEDCLINFDWNTKFLRRFFKALVYPYPLPRIKYQNKTYELLKVDLVEKSYYMTNGRVVNIDSDGVWVKIEDGLLVIKELIDVETDKKILSSDIFKIGVRLK